MLDTGFKIVFSNEKNMRYLLNALFGDGFALEVTFLNKEMNTERASGKRSYLDMRCRTSNGKDIVIEVQVKKQANFKERMLFYSSHIIQEQYYDYRDAILAEQNLQRGNQETRNEEGDEKNEALLNELDEVYVGGFTYKMIPTYVIAFLGFTPDRISEEGKSFNNDLIRTFEIRDSRSGELFSDKLRFTTVEVEKFDKKENELTSPLDMVLHSFKNMGNEKEMPDYFKGTPMENIYEMARIAALSRDKYNQYFEEVMKEEDRKDQLATAFHDGKKAGKADGREEEKRRIARNLLEIGTEVSTISKATGLSEEEILALKTRP